MLHLNAAVEVRMSVLTKEGFLELCPHASWACVGDLLFKYNKEKNVHVPLARAFLWVEQLVDEKCLITRTEEKRLQVRVTEEGVRARVRHSQHMQAVAPSFGAQTA